MKFSSAYEAKLLCVARAHGGGDTGARISCKGEVEAGHAHSCILRAGTYIKAKLDDLTESLTDKPHRRFHLDPIESGVLERIYEYRAHEHHTKTSLSM